MDRGPTLADGSRDFKLVDPDFATFAAVSDKRPHTSLVAPTRVDIWHVRQRMMLALTNAVRVWATPSCSFPAGESRFDISGQKLQPGDTRSTRLGGGVESNHS
jgi:hypothetical protein